MKIAMRLREVAETRGWTAPRIARRADLGDSTVYNLWNGVTQDPGIVTLLRIAAVIGVPVDSLYEVIPDGESEVVTPKNDEAPALALA